MEHPIHERYLIFCLTIWQNHVAAAAAAAYVFNVKGKLFREFQPWKMTWLRLFCFGFFRACPGQLLVYAICKEGYPENRGKKVALVSPAMEIRAKT